MTLIENSRGSNRVWKRNAKQDTLHLDNAGGSFKNPVTVLNDVTKYGKIDLNRTSLDA